ncbi:serine/threonine-protein kinase [Pyxidicoccus sp. MSG2]|uniref:serine/threonine-protein kinase n=1 Tax=Pyxidicoccus sp. MSG2 TaxID=2996790 RepID=UPI0022702198|nr:serine/threonine-protein kinase [Pyxidicoccus sp. MSG2]MCY1021018.1 protein kinase [Pyxidicoccus sp. MSG2]
MNFLCPACRTPLPGARPALVVSCSACGVQVDLARAETAPGTARLSPEVDLTGESLGGFRLLSRLGAGGMGTVYAAEGYPGACAVKVLSTLVAADPAVRARFRREAEALRQVQHPAVVRVLADGEERGFCWYAMERVDGPDLRAKLTKDGPLPWPEVEGLARRMLEALGAAHEKGFIHRDVKPGNILLAADGAKLCDFGIARLDGATTLTESAALIGSLRYMAPEQQRLGRAVAQSDLFALGLVLYESLAGGFPGEKPLPAGVPSRLRRLLARLLSERIEDRPDSAESARRLLERRVPVGALAVGTSAVMALAAFLFLGPASARQEPPVAKKDASVVTKDAAPTQPAPQATALQQESPPLPDSVPQPQSLDEPVQPQATPERPARALGTGALQPSSPAKAGAKTSPRGKAGLFAPGTATKKPDTASLKRTRLQELKQKASPLKE